MKIRSAAYLMLITILSMTPACNALDPEPDPTPSYERDVLPQALLVSSHKLRHLMPQPRDPVVFRIGGRESGFNHPAIRLPEPY